MVDPEASAPPILKPNRPNPRNSAAIKAALFEAARVIFQRRGFAAEMTEIAEYAGVGVGTLYRHFGNKDTLLRQVFLERQSEVLESAKSAAQASDAWEGLKSFLWLVATLEVDNRLTADMLNNPRFRPYFEGFRPRVHAILTPLLQRAQAAGQVRPDITSRHAIGLVAMVGKSIHFDMGEDPRTFWRQLVQIALDGMEATEPEPFSESLRLI